jgi:hypothetical protein
MLVTGFHGTTRSIAERLVSGELFWKPSTNEGDWLGFGSYFFQDGFERAQVWATHNCADPVVMEVEIDLTNCLDLLDISDWRLLRQYTRQAVIAGVTLPPQEELVVSGGRCKPPATGTPLQMRNKQDRFLVDFCVEQLRFSRQIDCVRGSFIWGHSLTKSSAIFNWGRVEIAVRNPAEAIKAQRIC